MLDDAEPVVAVTTTELMGRFAGCDLEVIDFERSAPTDWAEWSIAVTDG